MLEKITLFFLSNCSSYTVPTAGISLGLAILCSREAILHCEINYTFNQYTYFSFLLLFWTIGQAFNPENLYLLKNLKSFEKFWIPPYNTPFFFFLPLFFFFSLVFTSYVFFFSWLFPPPALPLYPLFLSNYVLTLILLFFYSCLCVRVGYF